MRAQRIRHNKFRLVAGLRFCLAAACVWPLLAAGQQVVTYPRPESDSDARASYPIALLNLCAERSKNSFVTKPSEFKAQQGRNIRQLALGDGLDVLWAVSTEERESFLQPIRIPIDRGLIGWRLLLIRNQDADFFSTISNGKQLAALRAGQGHDWPDVDVLRANNFTLSTSTTYEGLFKMLSLGHIQYFPRSISEIWSEAEKHQLLGIGIEKNLILHYPEALYFFVNKANAKLAGTLTACLNEMTLDGALQSLLNKFYGDSLQKAQLSHRKVIEIGNPLLPRNTPEASSIYWFSLTGSP